MFYIDSDLSFVSVSENVSCWNHSLKLEQVFTSQKYKDIYQALSSLSYDEYRALNRLGLLHTTQDAVDSFKRKLMTTILTKVESKPKFNLLRILLTDLCNLSCRYCKVVQNTECVKKSPVSDKKLSEVIRFFFDNSNEREEKIIHITGGEPTIFFDKIRYIVSEIKKYARKNENYWIVIGSNGILLDEEKVRYFLENQIKVIISMDGPKDFNDKYRITRGGKGTWEQVDRALMLLKKYHVEFSISAVVGAHNLFQMDDIIDWFVERYAPVGMGINFMKPPTRNEVNFEGLISEKEYALTVYNLHKKHRSKGIFFELVYRKLAPFVFQKYRCHDCGAANGSTLNINASGLIGPCKSFLVMNRLALKEYDIDNYQAMITKKWMNRSPVFYDSCQNCIARGACGNGCAYEALSYTNNDMGIDARACKYTQFFYSMFLKDLYDQIPHQIKNKKEWVYIPTQKNRLKLLGNVRSIPHSLSYSIGHNTL